MSTPSEGTSTKSQKNRKRTGRGTTNSLVGEHNRGYLSFFLPLVLARMNVQGINWPETRERKNERSFANRRL